jgi:hypothetical protein
VIRATQEHQELEHANVRMLVGALLFFTVASLLFRDWVIVCSSLLIKLLL